MYIIFTLIILFFAVPAWAEYPSKAEIRQYIRACAETYYVDPAFAEAVFTIESGLRCGPLGKKGRFIGPAGIDKSFRCKWNIDDPFINIIVGVAALRGKDKDRVLRRYNPVNGRNYRIAVLRLYRQIKKCEKRITSPPRTLALSRPSHRIHAPSEPPGQN